MGIDKAVEELGKQVSYLESSHAIEYDFIKLQIIEAKIEVYNTIIRALTLGNSGDE